MFPAGEKSTGGAGNLATATPGLSGSGFASTGPGEGGEGPILEEGPVLIAPGLPPGWPPIAPGSPPEGYQKTIQKRVSKKDVRVEPKGVLPEAQESPRRPNRSQKAPKRLPNELPKSMILGFGQETNENVKIAFPSRRQLSFQGSGTLEIELFL